MDDIDVYYVNLGGSYGFWWNTHLVVALYNLLRKKNTQKFQVPKNGGTIPDKAIFWGGGVFLTYSLYHGEDSSVLGTERNLCCQKTRWE